MSQMPITPDCNDFVPMNGEFPYSGAHRREHPDCTECVYFSRRNCGNDTGHDNFLFDQPLL
ncbi:MAG: hypothetical protein FWE91_08670 [Defluviitaleaceae bacterium]|nr:hypothetical protein [Defluviitaleaceae bacterium]MCL2837286.1 hypothetical protein [Defluviitaleaceae bacterium]